MEVKSDEMTALKNSSQRLTFGRISFSLHMLTWKEEVYKFVLGADEVEQRAQRCVSNQNVDLSKRTDRETNLYFVLWGKMSERQAAN